MASTRRRRRQVQSEAQVRFGPEASALRELLIQAVSDREGSVQAAEGAARGITAAARAGRPQLQGVYGRARETHEGTGQTLKDLLRVDPSNPLGGAIERERAGAARRIGDQEAGALTELTKREQEAASGRAFAVQNARSQFQGDAAKIRRRLVELGREEGAFGQGRLAELAEADAERIASERQARADRGQSERNSQRSAGINPDTGEPIPGGPLDEDADGRAGGKKREPFKRSQEAKSKHRKVLSDVEAVRGTIRQLKQGGDSYSDIRQVLNLPRSEDNPFGLGGNESAARWRHIINAALNLEEEKFLGGVNTARLRNEGLIFVPPQWRRRRRSGPIPRF